MQCLLSFPQQWQQYCIECLHPTGHSMTAVMFRGMMDICIMPVQRIRVLPVVPDVCLLHFYCYTAKRFEQEASNRRCTNLQAFMASPVPAAIFCLCCHAVLQVDTNSLDGYNASFSRTLLIRVRMLQILEVIAVQN